MPSRYYHASQFVQVLRRRMLLQCIADRAGLCVLWTSLAAILLLPLSVWGPMPMVANAIVICGIAIVTAAIVSLRGWPTLAAAAAIADRQLALDDLLTTVLNLRPVPFDDLSDVVIAMADARCRGVSPAEIEFPRFTVKAWSGIALAAAIAIALALVPIRSANSYQADSNTNVLASALDASAASDLTQAASVVPAARPDPTGEDESQMISPTDTSDSGKAASAGNANQSAPGGGDARVGGGASATNKPSAAETANRAAAVGDPSHLTGIASGGGLESSDHRAGGDVAPGMTVGRSSASPLIPAWRSTDWPATRAAALSSVRNGAVPPGCRDLVRDYFQ